MGDNGATLQTGDVLQLSDELTGFDHLTYRPYCIIRTFGDPPYAVLVVPRSTRTSQGTLTPARVLPGLSKEGRFLYRAYRLTGDELSGARSLGRLPEPYLTRVLENVNTAEH